MHGQHALCARTDDKSRISKVGIKLTEMGWENVSLYSKYFVEELKFLIALFLHAEAYRDKRMVWHRELCMNSSVRSFMFYVEEHVFYLAFLIIVATKTLRERSSLSTTLREKALTMNTVLPQQLCRTAKRRFNSFPVSSI